MKEDLRKQNNSAAESSPELKEEKANPENGSKKKEKANHENGSDLVHRIWGDNFLSDSLH